MGKGRGKMEERQEGKRDEKGMEKGRKREGKAGRGKVGKGKEMVGERQAHTQGTARSETQFKPVPALVQGGITAPQIGAGFGSAVPKSHGSPWGKQRCPRQTRSVDFRHVSNEHLPKDSFRHREQLVTWQGRLPPD